jgi:hypothetical protein
VRRERLLRGLQFIAVTAPFWPIRDRFAPWKQPLQAEFDVADLPMSVNGKPVHSGLWPTYS